MGSFIQNFYKMRTLNSANRQLKLQYSEFRESRKKSEKEKPDREKLCIRNELLVPDTPRILRKQLSHSKVTNHMSLIAVKDVVEEQRVAKQKFVERQRKRNAGNKVKRGSIISFRRKFCCF